VFANLTQRGWIPALVDGVPDEIQRLELALGQALHGPGRILNAC
jgi:hypothetical protein